jgi:hypothetical protein
MAATDTSCHQVVARSDYTETFSCAAESCPFHTSAETHTDSALRGHAMPG